MIVREPHTFNGKFVGVWYTFADGRQMYLAHYSGEKTKGLLRDKNAWRMDASVLRQAERRGCNAIGVIHRVGKHKYLYLTNRDDFWNSPASIPTLLNSMSQRALPRNKFLVNPSFDRQQIAEHIKLR